MHSKNLWTWPMPTCNTTQKVWSVLSKRPRQSNLVDVGGYMQEYDEILKCIPGHQPISNKDLRQTAFDLRNVSIQFMERQFHSEYGLSAHPRTDVYMLQRWNCRENWDKEAGMQCV